MMLMFVLMVGTKKPDGRGEEYRYILPGQIEPSRTAQLCRLPSGEMNIPFLKLRFRNAIPHPSFDAAFGAIKASGMVRIPYVVQVEHFPDQHFPSA